MREAFEELDPDDEYGNLIDGELAYQAGFLTGFLQDLKNGKISEAQARARAKQYAASLGKLRERIKAERTDKDSRGKWSMNPTLENCPDCIELNGQIHTMAWFLANHIPRDGNTQCGQNCGCSISPV